MSLFCGAIIALVSAQLSQAQIVVNGSLENTGSTFINNGNGAMALSPGSMVIPGWTVVHDSLAWVQNINTYGLTTPFGTSFLDLTGYHDNASYGGIAQMITTTPGQDYVFSLSIGSDQTQAIHGGTKSVAVTAGSSSKGITFIPSSARTVQWGTFSFDFIATSTSTDLTVLGTSSGTGMDHLGLDNISVVLGSPPRAVARAVDVWIFWRRLAWRFTSLGVRSV